jgi:hypothetical protein
MIKEVRAYNNRQTAEDKRYATPGKGVNCHLFNAEKEGSAGAVEKIPGIIGLRESQYTLHYTVIKIDSTKA